MFFSLLKQLLWTEPFWTCPVVFDRVRSKNTYTYMIQELKSLAEQMEFRFMPEIIMTDFEGGLMSMLKNEVIFLKIFLFIKFLVVSASNALILLFSFCAGYIYRAIQRFGLTTIYNDDQTVKVACREIMALALLPSIVIKDIYEKQLFEKIPIKKWCVHDHNIRTNNHAEGK